MAHTPGPWVALTWLARNPIDRPYYRFIEGGSGYFFHLKPEESRGFCVTGFLHDADARLLAAAPDLLASLQELTADCELVDTAGGAGPENWDALKRARAAIAKATGDSH
jgi:hypothetical protein